MESGQSHPTIPAFKGVKIELNGLKDILVFYFSNSYGSSTSDDAPISGKVKSQLNTTNSDLRATIGYYIRDVKITSYAYGILVGVYRDELNAFDIVKWLRPVFPERKVNIETVAYELARAEGLLANKLRAVGIMHE